MTRCSSRRGGPNNRWVRGRKLMRSAARSGRPRILSLGLASASDSRAGQKVFEGVATGGELIPNLVGGVEVAFLARLVALVQEFLDLGRKLLGLPGRREDAEDLIDGAEGGGHV